jgi:hypothetical protein
MGRNDFNPPSLARQRARGGGLGRGQRDGSSLRFVTNQDGAYAVYHDNQQLCHAFLRMADDVAVGLGVELD